MNSMKGLYLNELRAILRLLEQGDCREASARDVAGNPVHPSSYDAAVWCVHGAAERVVADRGQSDADADNILMLLDDVIGVSSFAALADSFDGPAIIRQKLREYLRAHKAIPAPIS